MRYILRTKQNKHSVGFSFRTITEFYVTSQTYSEIKKNAQGIIDTPYICTTSITIEKAQDVEQLKRTQFHKAIVYRTEVVAGFLDSQYWNFLP